ncbi:uncharacterized protein LOC112472585 [Pteropus alecto]|uniref:uncharacterized protein LOC112472585 n=1 Tax=Pteropus alecto TaxID=9402 RepID=UPI000D539DFF|nr:uncharacterized protein LOC112472585 [Pteropus alecto]
MDAVKRQLAEESLATWESQTAPGVSCCWAHTGSLAPTQCRPQAPGNSLRLSGGAGPAPSAPGVANTNGAPTDQPHRQKTATAPGPWGSQRAAQLPIWKESQIPPVLSQLLVSSSEHCRPKGKSLLRHRTRRTVRLLLINTDKKNRELRAGAQAHTHTHTHTRTQEIKGQRTGAPGGLSEAGVFPVLRAARGATGCQRRGEENAQPERGVGAKLCSPESGLGCQARKPPRGQCKRRPIPRSAAGAAENSGQDDPRREVRGAQAQEAGCEQEGEW